MILNASNYCCFSTKLKKNHKNKENTSVQGETASLMLYLHTFPYKRACRPSLQTHHHPSGINPGQKQKQRYR